jgi:hypothetical protein
MLALAISVDAVNRKSVVAACLTAAEQNNRNFIEASSLIPE